MNKHQITTVIIAAILIAIIGATVFAVLDKPAGTQIQALAKGDYLGKRVKPECRVADRQGVKAVLTLASDATVSVFDAYQARQYAHYLRNGWTNKPRRMRIYGVEGPRFPMADKMYIVNSPSIETVFPLFVVDGCIVHSSVSVSKRFHAAILHQMEGVKA